MSYEEQQQIARARQVLHLLIARPRKAYEITELCALTFDETLETLEWLRAKGYANRLDIIGELHSDWVALRAME